MLTLTLKTLNNKTPANSFHSFWQNKNTNYHKEVWKILTFKFLGVFLLINGSPLFAFPMFEFLFSHEILKDISWFLKQILWITTKNFKKLIVLKKLL